MDFFVLVTGTDAGEREDLMAKDNSELAILYQVETKTFNHAVKRNIERFPENFRFQLKKEGRGGRRYLPYVFTEQGIAMLSAVLRSDIAIQVSIRISSVSDTAGRMAADGGGHPDGGAKPHSAFLHERNEPGLSGSPVSHLF